MLGTNDTSGALKVSASVDSSLARMGTGNENGSTSPSRKKSLSRDASRESNGGVTPSMTPSSSFRSARSSGGTLETVDELLPEESYNVDELKQLLGQLMDTQVMEVIVYTKNREAFKRGEGGWKSQPKLAAFDYIPLDELIALLKERENNSKTIVTVLATVELKERRRKEEEAEQAKLRARLRRLEETSIGSASATKRTAAKLKASKSQHHRRRKSTSTRRSSDRGRVKK
eukprot:TRINITY_DN360_c1_g1_i8.p1 TRINITY_DN360_c1_g1~~TRINITY_DN360_c1_g1_i8.p1  ORF type:complete len:230 (-),score=61.34 TRINITY_DN360_c1_g1_i8:1232-1921(-)